MKATGALLAALVAQSAGAAPTYVSDDLVLGVYASESAQGARLATLHSGAAVETLETHGDSTRVRLPDGTVGWVKSSYLTSAVPNAVRLKQLQDEVARSGAAGPMLAEAAAHNEAQDLGRELESTRAERDAARVALAAALNATGRFRSAEPMVWCALIAGLLAGGGGYWLGHAMLARKIRDKFGGLKVY